MPKTKSKKTKTGNTFSALMEPGMPFPGIRKPVTISDTGLRTYTLMVGESVKVIEDKRSKTKVMNLPFEFPDGTRGIAIICKIKDDPWKPSDDIMSITVNFHGQK